MNKCDVRLRNELSKCVQMSNKHKKTSCLLIETGGFFFIEKNLVLLYENKNIVFFANSNFVVFECIVNCITIE